MTISVLLVLLAILILIADVLYLTNVPIAMKAVTQPVPRLGLKRAIGKAALQGTVYPLAFVWLGVRALRRVAGTK